MSTPVSFTVKIFDEQLDTENTSNHSSDSGDLTPPLYTVTTERPQSIKSNQVKKPSPSSESSFISPFACFSDISTCLEESSTNKPYVGDLSAFPRSQHRDILTPYSSLTPIAKKGSRNITLLRTKTPIWNTELHSWSHNFSGRVKIPHSRNFIVIGMPKDSIDGRSTPLSMMEDDVNSEKICIRHGKVKTLTKM